MRWSRAWLPALVVNGVSIPMGRAQIVIATLISKWIAGQLYEVRAVDPWTFTFAAGALTVASMLACYVPARRATRIDPMQALRNE